MVYGYHDLNADLVWLVIREKLPVLRAELEAALPPTTP